MYNEVVVNSTWFIRHLPGSIEAIVYFEDKDAEPKVNAGGVVAKDTRETDKLAAYTTCVAPLDALTLTLTLTRALTLTLTVTVTLTLTSTLTPTFTLTPTLTLPRYVAFLDAYNLTERQVPLLAMSRGSADLKNRTQVRVRVRG